jgi:hypothetical protein
MTDIAGAAHEARTVRKARPNELGRLAAVLASAFYDGSADQVGPEG